MNEGPYMIEGGTYGGTDNNLRQGRLTVHGKGQVGLWVGS